MGLSSEHAKKSLSGLCLTPSVCGGDVSGAAALVAGRGGKILLLRQATAQSLGQSKSLEAPALRQQDLGALHA